MKNTITLLCACANYRTCILGMTQDEIAHKIGVTQAHYSNFENGKSQSSKILKWFFSQPDFVKLIYEHIEEMTV